jgi:hypothetical protein
MSDKRPLVSALSVSDEFKIDQVDRKHVAAVAAAAPAAIAPNLGPLAAFVGNWTGRGLNTIFRPDRPQKPTPMPGPVNTTDPDDNVLELNLTDETLSFSQSLGSVPNRGSGAQPDIFLNGVPYLQTISDVTTAPATGIHFEPGMWLAVPATNVPTEPITVARLASIPHGTTIIAQGLAMPAATGKPTINSLDITPFIGGQPNNKVRFQNQTAANKATRRIPQDLTPFIAAGTITQAILDDPNTILRTQLQHQTVKQTVAIEISTRLGAQLPGGPLASGAHPASPHFGGGTSNIAFLLGQAVPPPGGPGSNANSVQMDALFFVETVTYTVTVPQMPAGTPPIVLDPNEKGTVPLVPRFLAAIPFVPGKGFAGGTVTVNTIQIQYSQKVLLDFNGLSWPHVSVASLVPADPIAIPESLLPLT